MRWSEAVTVEFVKMYLKHECLWNPNHPGYKIKYQREKAYFDICSEFKTSTMKTLTVPETQETPDVDSSCQIWVDQGTQQDNEEMNPDPLSNSEDDDFESSKTEESTPIKKERLSQPSKKIKKKKYKHRNLNQTQDYSKNLSFESTKEDEFDIYGKYIASQLRKMDLHKALRLQLEIQSLVSEARLSEITSILLNEHELKTKIKNLRSTYVQELSKIKQRSIGEYEYKPTIKWFEYWDSCFRKSQDHRCSDAGYEESELEQEQKQNLWLPEDSEILCGVPDPFEAQTNDNLEIILKSEPGVQPKINRTLKYKMKRKKLRHRISSKEVYDQTLKNSFESLDTCKEDEFDIYGKYIASQLRTMDLKRALRLQFEIQSLVSGARLSDLSS
ncbi:unnamed protein product [Danaus chrysippus]|uniref:(African queen) hypothetical protein n=1 Tax=Danaus chrysippus TaxID=151541 RepID=A0A8J2QKV1_9NEOP|nr:unnamed protein product [Danaus chrysippus]